MDSPTASHSFPHVIDLNIGGKYFTTSWETLTKYPESMLGAMFSGRMVTAMDPHGRYFIDRDGTYFGYILNFLRHGEILLPHNFNGMELLRREADFYQIPPLVSYFEKVDEQKEKKDPEILDFHEAMETFVQKQHTRKQRRFLELVGITNAELVRGCHNRRTATRAGVVPSPRDPSFLVSICFQYDSARPEDDGSLCDRLMKALKDKGYHVRRMGVEVEGYWGLKVFTAPPQTASPPQSPPPETLVEAAGSTEDGSEGDENWSEGSSQGL